MKKLGVLSLLVLLLLSACAKEPTEPGVDLELQREMNQLFSQLDFVQARSLLQGKMAKGLADPTVLGNYGFMEYKIFQDYGRAKKALTRATRLAPDSPDMHMLMGEMYFHQGQYSSSIAKLNTAAELSGTAAGWNNELAKIYYLMGKAYRSQGDSSSAIESLETSVQYNPFRTETSTLLHQLYVEDMNYSRAYEIWKIGNSIVDGADPLLARIAECNELYQQALAGIATPKEMAELYSELRLYDEALVEYTRAAEENGEDLEVNKELNRIEIFIEFRNKLALFMEDYYRERCQGGVEFNDYPKLAPIYSKIAALLGEEPGQSKSWVNNVNDKVEREFGVGLDFIMDSGVLFGLNFGYVVDDFTTRVSQWGSTGNFRLIVLRDMVSNGLISWLSDGAGGVGGWNLGDNLMFAVQDSSGTILTSLDLLDEDKRTASLHTAKEYDGTLSGKEPAEIFFSKTLVHKLAENQINAEIKWADEAGIAEELRGSYIITKYQNNYLFTTIIVHEGQHALDKYFPNTWYGELEYRAKLSELAYGELQYRTLANLHTPAAGTDVHDQHTAANTRVFEDIIQHILDNSEQYPEINSNQNIMIQLDKLSQEQLKQIAIAVFEDKYPDEMYQ